MRPFDHDATRGDASSSLDGDESDPTGVRAILAALPEPGPMPADLVARISAALAAEQAGQAGSTDIFAVAGTDEPGQRDGQVGPAHLAGATVHSLAETRRGRANLVRRLPGIAIAASAVVLAGGVTLGLIGMDRGLTMMGGDSDSSSGVEMSAVDTSDTEDSGSDSGSDPSTAAAEDSAARIMASDAMLTSASVLTYAQALLDGSAAPEAEGSSAAGDPVMPLLSTDAGSMGTSEGVADCLSGLLALSPQEAAAHLIAADLVRFDGEPAALLITQVPDSGAGVSGPAGASIAYLVARDCDRENAVPLREPVLLAS